MKKMRKSSNYFYKRKKDISKETTKEELEKEYFRLMSGRERENEYLKQVKKTNVSLKIHLANNKKHHSKTKEENSRIKFQENINQTSFRSSFSIPKLDIGLNKIDLSEFKKEDYVKKVEEFVENVDVFEIFDKEQSFLNLKQERLDQMSLGLEEIRYEIRRVDEVIFFLIILTAI